MPILKPKKVISRKKLASGEEAKCSVIRVPGRKRLLVERRIRKTSLFGRKSRAYGVMGNAWVHKFVHLLFPNESINVLSTVLPKKSNGEALMYSIFIPQDAQHLNETKRILGVIKRAHKGEITREEADRQVKEFDIRMRAKYDLDSIEKKMAEYGIKPQHPEVNIVKKKGDGFVLAEFKIDTKKARKAVKRIKDPRLRKQAQTYLRRIEIYKRVMENSFGGPILTYGWKGVPKHASKRIGARLIMAADELLKNIHKMEDSKLNELDPEHQFKYFNRLLIRLYDMKTWRNKTFWIEQILGNYLKDLKEVSKYPNTDRGNAERNVQLSHLYHEYADIIRNI